MSKKLNIFLLILIGIFIFNTRLKAQSIGYYLGTMYPDLKEINPIINQTYHFKQESYKGVFLEYPLSRKFSVSGGYGRTKAWSGFVAEDELRVVGNGSARTKLNRFGVQLNYDILHKYDKIKLSPYIRIDYQHNDVQTKGLTKTFTYLPDPNNNYDGEIYVETFEGGQIMPTLGLRVSISPFWRIWIFGEYFYGFGHETAQRYYFDYNYKGVPQERAEWHTEGRGWVRTVGIAIQLWDATD